MRRVDFVVVGGGIAGASAGYELAGRGSVVLLEQEQTTGYHTTGRSAALYTESYETGPVRALTMASRSFFEDPPAGITETPLLSPLPVLFIARDDQLALLDELVDAAGHLVRLERIDRDGLQDVCPALRSDQIAGGLLEHGSMEIDVHALHQGFLTGMRSRGGQVLTGTPASTIERDGDGWTVTAGGLVIKTPVVVDAAGAWCDDVAALAGIDPMGLQPYRRTAFTFAPGEHDITTWPMVVDADEDFYFKPERTQLMGSLAEETPMPPHDVRPEEIDVALAIERITTAASLDITHVARTWAGLRTFARDRLPVVGFEPDSPGFFWLGGQGGYGIMTAPALGRAAAGLICDATIPQDLRDRGVSAAVMSPERFRK